MNVTWYCSACGHSQAFHCGDGGCIATVDRRPVTAGGSELSLCGCRASDRSLVGAQPEEDSVGALRQRAPETREGGNA